MPNNNRRSSSFSLLRNVFKDFLFHAKLKKPILPSLKTRRLKQFKNYSFYVKEYEFSPSTTPLIHFHRSRRLSLRIKFQIKDAYLSISRFLCLGDDEVRDMKQRRMLDYPFPCQNNNLISRTDSWDYYRDEDGDDDDSVDVRAERFIQRFYQDITRQTMDSQLNLIPTF